MLARFILIGNSIILGSCSEPVYQVYLQDRVIFEGSINSEIKTDGPNISRAYCVLDDDNRLQIIQY